MIVVIIITIVIGFFMPEVVVIDAFNSFINIVISTLFIVVFVVVSSL